MRHSPAIAAGFAVCGLAAVVNAQSFTLLGLPPGGTSSRGMAVSDDGSVVGGRVFGGPSAGGFRWTASDGMYLLRTEPNATATTEVYGMSGNGQVLTGGGGSRAFRWSGPGTLEYFLPQSGYSNALGTDANQDGSVLVGYSHSGGAQTFGQAFRWTSTTGLAGLGYTRPGHFYSEATAVSADGNLVTGYSRSTSSYDAFVWSQAGGMQILPALPGGSTTRAHAMNSTGTIIVGTSGNFTPTMWVNGQVMDLGTPLGLGGLVAQAVNESGTLVGGMIQSPGSGTAFVWTPSRGTETLLSYLAFNGISIPAGVNPVTISSISADGRVLSGYTGQPGQGIQAFVVVVPAPSTVWIGAAGLILTVRRRRHLAVTLGVAGFAGLASAQSFTLLGLPTGGTSARGMAVSDDGSVVGGRVFGGTSAGGFRWTASDGMYFLRSEPNSSASTEVYGMSGNGQVLTGGGGSRAFRWSGSGTLEYFLPQSGYSNALGTDASQDGSVLVGYSHSGGAQTFGQAFRWTSTTGLVGLGYTRPGHFYSEATAVSADGNFVTGYSRSTSSYDAFVWTQAGGMQILPQLPGTVGQNSMALAMNSTGTIVVGRSGSPLSPVMWREGQIIELGVPSGFGVGRALAVNDAGTLVGGMMDGPHGDYAFVWTPEFGSQTLTNYLASFGVIVPENVNPSVITSVSRDGTVLSGYTGQPGTVREAFIAVIPAPSTAAITVSVLMLASHRRRK